MTFPDRPSPAIHAGAIRSAFFIGKTLRASAALYPKLFLMFSVAPLVEWLPNLLTIDNSGDSDFDTLRSVAAVFLDIVLGTVGEAIVVGGVIQCLRKEAISLRKPLDLVIRRFASLLALSILIATSWLVGFVLLIIPCLFFITIMYVAIPAFQIEGLGPVASIKRSVQLTKGYRWTIFALMLLTAGLQVMVDQGLQWLYSWSGGAFAALAAMLLWNTLWGLFSSIVIGVAYFELRTVKEAVDVRQIVAVFD
jgi:hypothetical protein